MEVIESLVGCLLVEGGRDVFPADEYGEGIPATEEGASVRLSDDEEMLPCRGEAVFCLEVAEEQSDVEDDELEGSVDVSPGGD